MLQRALGSVEGIFPSRTIFSLFLLVLSAISLQIHAQNWVQLEPHLSENSVVKPELRDKFIWGDRADPDATHRCIIYIKDSMHDKMMKISHDALFEPTSDLYGKNLMDKEMIDALTKNKIAVPPGRPQVMRYLQDAGVDATVASNGLINAVARVSVWEDILNTKFYTVRNTVNNKEIIRAHEYYFPAHLAKYVSKIGNTVRLPTRLRKYSNRGIPEQPFD